MTYCIFWCATCPGETVRDTCFRMEKFECRNVDYVNITMQALSRYFSNDSRLFLDFYYGYINKYLGARMDWAQHDGASQPASIDEEVGNKWKEWLQNYSHIILMHARKIYYALTRLCSWRNAAISSACGAYDCISMHTTRSLRWWCVENSWYFSYICLLQIIVI